MFRALNNNNPLCIRRSTTRWTGALPTQKQTDPEYVQYKSLALGYRAAWKWLDCLQLRVRGQPGQALEHWRQYGQAFTMGTVVRSLMPMELGDDPDAMILYVMEQLNIGPDYPLPNPASSPDGLLHQLLAVMTAARCGGSADDYSDAIREGWYLSFASL